MFGLFGKNKATHDTPRQKETAPHHWPSILSRADRIHLDAVAALNVRVICELAPLVQDRSRSQAFQRDCPDYSKRDLS
jgi:hypothetical protein